MRKTLFINLLCFLSIHVFSQPINELYKVLPDVPFDQNLEDRFGESVAVDGDYAVAGAPEYNGKGCSYVLYKNGASWEQLAILTASDGAVGDDFGYSVFISGENIIVGARGDGLNGISGSAYVFTKPTGGWEDMTETAILSASDIAVEDYFGISVCISGDNIVVGAYGKNVETGSVYVFTKPISGWENMTETAILTASDGAENDNFGCSVSISGVNVVVGANNTDNDGNNKGSAYVYTKPSGGWENMTQTAKLASSNSAAYDQFGYSVSISEDNIVIGAPYTDDAWSNIGSAYIFAKPSGGWEDMTETVNLTASDIAANLWFGYSVIISGDNIVVNAFLDDENGFASGSAYVFTKPLTGWENMTETAKLLASDGEASDYFGKSIGISGDNIIIGAYSDDDAGDYSGSVYAFSKPVGDWVNANEDQKLISDLYTGYYEGRFGYSVSIDGEYAVVGMTGYKNSQGCAYVLHYTGSIWEIKGLLTNSDGEASDYFGYSVFISGDNIVVGAYGDSENGSFSGSVYVFTKPLSGWESMTEIATLTALDGAEYDYFGISVSMSGDNIVVGANGDGSSSGSAYIFTKALTGWENMTETAKLTASDGAEEDKFGNSVSISGDNIVVGAYGNDDNGNRSGSAYIFTKPIEEWVNMTETAKFLASDASAENWFGYSVSIFEDDVVVGAIGDIDNGDFSGSVYVFTKPSGGWTNMTETAKLTASDGAEYDNFGKSVSISGDNIVISAPYSDDDGNNTGSVYLFSKPSDSWDDMTETAKLAAADASADDYFGYSVSISGDNIIIGALSNNLANNSGSAYFYKRNSVNITSQPTDQLDINEEANISFSISAENAEFYQWQVSNDDGDSFLNISDNDTYSNSATENLSVVSSNELNNNKYRCIVSNEWGKVNSESAVLTIKSTTAINELNLQAFSVYPNPAKDKLYIDFNESKSGLVQIYDVTGKLVAEKNVTEQTEIINISELVNGMYIVQIRSEENSISYKIMKE